MHGSEGALAFVSPKTGGVEVVHVTTGPHHGPTPELYAHVWHIEIAGDVATVSPSVHFLGHFHSGNPAHFRLISGNA